jgi:hypothetical protein
MAVFPRWNNMLLQFLHHFKTHTFAFSVPFESRSHHLCLHFCNLENLELNFFLKKSMDTTEKSPRNFCSTSCYVHGFDRHTFCSAETHKNKTHGCYSVFPRRPANQWLKWLSSQARRNITKCSSVPSSLSEILINFLLRNSTTQNFQACSSTVRRSPCTAIHFLLPCIYKCQPPCNSWKEANFLTNCSTCTVK